MTHYNHPPSRLSMTPTRGSNIGLPPTRSSSSLSTTTNPNRPNPRVRPASSLGSLNISSSSRIRPNAPRNAANSPNPNLFASSGPPNRSRSSMSMFAPPMRPASQMSIRSAGSSRAGSRPASRQGYSRPSSSMSMLTPSPTFSSFNNSNSYSGTIKVAIRPRPLDGRVPGSNINAWTINHIAGTISNFDMGDYSYDHVFEPFVKNDEVYVDVVKPVVDQCLDGFNGTIFAYGMTGSGKTYSMQGSNDEPGLIHLCVNELFERLKSTEGEEIKISCSYLEIYNEKLYDLLNPESANSLKKSTMSFNNNSSHDDLKIRDDPIYGVKVHGLREVDVLSSSDLLNTIKQGDTIRKTGGTDFNARSSRSHAVVLIRIANKDITTGVDRVSTLSLCDLAGSEKAASHAERRKEGSFINKSLLALSTVISKLSQGSSNHIPYRDSKLTRLLQPALSGNAIVAILCTIHLSTITLAETANTLRFASRAKNITVTVRKTEVSGLMDKEKYISQLLQTNEAQKLEIETLKTTLANNNACTSLNMISNIDDSRCNSPLSSIMSVTGAGIGIGSNPILDENSQYGELMAENKILNEQVEHLKRLNDTSMMNSIIMHNDGLQQLIQLQMNYQLQDPRFDETIFSLENSSKQQLSKMDEMKSYITHLENQLQSLTFEKTVNEKKNQLNETSKATSQLIKDKDGEIEDLKSLLKSKDSIIKALRSTSKVRGIFDDVTERKSSSSTPTARTTTPSSPLINDENKIQKQDILSPSPSKAQALKTISNVI